MPLFHPTLSGCLYSNAAFAVLCLFMCFSEDYKVKLYDHTINFQVSTSERSSGFFCLYPTDLISETKYFFRLLFPWLSSAGLCISSGEFLRSCVCHCRITSVMVKCLAMKKSCTKYQNMNRPRYDESGR